MNQPYLVQVSALINVTNYVMTPVDHLSTCHEGLSQAADLIEKRRLLMLYLSLFGCITFFIALLHHYYLSSTYYLLILLLSHEGYSLSVFLLY